MAQQERLAFATELAEQLRVHPATVRRWVADGRIAAIRLPSGRYRISADEVSRLIAGMPQRQEPQA